MRHPSLGNSTPLPGPAPGWKTKTHKRYISKDRTLLKTLEQACKKDEKSRKDVQLWITQLSDLMFRNTSRDGSTASFYIKDHRVSSPAKQISQHIDTRPINRVWLEKAETF